MAKLGISTGIVPDDGTGDSLLDGAIKINSNFDEIYTYFGDGTDLTFLNDGSSNWSSTIVGIHTLSNVGIGTTNPTDKLTVRGGDISVGIDTSHGVVLTSPNGTQYRLIVDNAGALGTSSIP
jgi:hypothetical protein